MSSELLIAILGGLGAMLGWGLSDFFAKKTVDKIGDIRTLFWGQALGIIPLFLYYLTNFSWPQFSPSSLLMLLVLALLDTFGYILFYKGLEKGKVSIISPVVASYSAFAVIVSAFIFGEIIKPFLAVGIVLVIVGIIFTSLDLNGLRDGSIDRRDLAKGLPEALLAVLLLAFWFPLWDNFISHNSWIAMLMALRIAIVVIVGLFGKINQVSVQVNDRSLWKWLLMIGLFDGGAYLALSWGYGTANLTSIVSVLSSAFSLPTLILARIFLKEKLQLSQLLGILTIIGGMIWLAYAGGH